MQMCWVTVCVGVSYFFALGNSRTRACCACSRCGSGYVGHLVVSFLYTLLPLSLSLSDEIVQHDRFYTLTGPLNSVNQNIKFSLHILFTKTKHSNI